MNKVNKVNNINVYLFISVCFILIIILELLYKPHVTTLDDSKIKVNILKDSILNLKFEYKYLIKKDSILQHQYDSLKKLPPIIKTKTIEKVKVINSSTDVNQLDSIIRSNW